MWWYLLYFAIAANAVAFASPTTTSDFDKQDGPFAILEPTKVPVDDGRARKLVRRATTLEAPASVCGYFAGSKQSRLACYNSNACVFHSSNANFPAMMGCCPTVSTTTPCTFISTCYGSSQLAANSHRAYSNDPFVMLCTGDQDPYCHTRTWPGLSIADYQCTYSASSGAETMFTIGSLTDVTIDADQITETIAISWVDDSALLAARGLSTTGITGTKTTGTQTIATQTTATERPGDNDGDPDEDPDSKSSTGTILGGVLGGVGGVLVVVIIVLFVWRSKRKRAAETTETVPDKVDPEPFDGVGGDTEPMIHEMHGIDARQREELMPKRTYVELPAPEVRHQLE
ncbi:hypothetical protein ACJ73_07130 [Blastomyces percursus]|uniref:Mid2 domain-containing protein n=1 Tax=Blastomyces percursus TaxID=1658174 RepID=A0A1J9QMV3_9EURO|nr:hypothetical protein ACJ73_07130 [Blastomyces percursus]